MNQALDWLSSSSLVSKNDIVHFINSDDYLANNSIYSRVVDCMKNDIDIVCGSILFVDKEMRQKRALSSRFVNTKFGYLFGAKPPHPGFFCKAKYYLIERYTIKYSIAADYKLMLKILMNNSNKIKVINDILVKMRVGGKSTENLSAFFIGQIESFNVRKEFFGNLLAILGIFKPLISFKFYK